MKTMLATTALAGLSLIAIPFANAQCKATNSEYGSNIRERMEEQDAFSRTIFNDIRQLRRAAVTLAERVQMDACKAIVEAIDEIFEDHAT